MFMLIVRTLFRKLCGLEQFQTKLLAVYTMPIEIKIMCFELIKLHKFSIILVLCFSVLSPLFFSLQEQYIFLHQVLADFLDKFDIYSNFKM